MSGRKLAVKVGLCAGLALGGIPASAAENEFDELAEFPGQAIPQCDKGMVNPIAAIQGMVGYCSGLGGYEIPLPGDGYYYPQVEGDRSLRARIDQVVVDGVTVPELSAEPPS